MSNYLPSNGIKVFPCGGRDSADDPLARLTTEYNLVHIINRLVDKKSFIVTPYDQGEDISNMENEYMINIGGYLFIIQKGPKSILERIAPFSNNDTYVIAKISLQKYDDAYWQLAPYDDESPTAILDRTDECFYGIKFEASSTPSTAPNTLTLFETNGSQWFEYEDSKIKFINDGKSRSVSIDDGVI